MAASDLLLRLVYNGLRLRPGYMPRHRDRLEILRRGHADVELRAYSQALRDTFGDDYVAHLESWIREANAATDER
jgi:hypothetical protein